MEEPGQKLRRIRERLNLRVRDVEQASLKIADKYHNDDFAVLINRVSEIENRNLVPTIHKLYSLCAIYRLDFQEVLGMVWDLPWQPSRRRRFRGCSANSSAFFSRQYRSRQLW